jgi:hypothetical protein
VSDPPLCGAVEAGVLLEFDDPHPARIPATTAMAITGADRMNLRL